MAISDLDGDTIPDIVAAVVMDLPDSDEICVLLGRGDGTFAAWITAGAHLDRRQLDGRLH